MLVSAPILKLEAQGHNLTNDTATEWDRRRGTECDNEAFFLSFFGHIERAKWISPDNATSMSHVEQRAKYIGYVQAFLLDL